MKRKILFTILFVVYICFVAGIIYSATVAFRSEELYHYIKTPHRGWEGDMHMPDPVLGYKPIPNAAGYETFENGKKIPLWYNGEGFRAPPDIPSIDLSKKPVLLFLGCSFTYGSACRAEDTFPFILGKKMNGTVINAGVISYGFAHMVLLARDLIPKYRPDFVFVQSSPWLMTRAIHMYRESSTGRIPMPYFAEIAGKERIMPPPYVTNMLSLNIPRYKKTKASLKDFISFLWGVGFPYYAYDDFHYYMSIIKMKLGLLPGPKTDPHGLEDAIYDEIYRICEENGSIMVVVFMGHTDISDKVKELRYRRKDLIFIDVEKPLWAELKEKTIDAYNKAYKHWEGDPPVMIDRHPNKKAHSIMAEAIYRGILLHEYIIKKIAGSGVRKLKQ